MKKIQVALIGASMDLGKNPRRVSLGKFWLTHRRGWKFNMCNSNEGQQDPDFGLHSSSSSRPPQLNQTVCGCRCGCGIGHGNEHEDNDRDEDGAMTLVASDASDDGEGIDTMELAVITNPLRSQLHQEMRLRSSRPCIVFASPGTTAVSSSESSRPASSCDGMAESMENEPGSGK